MQFSREIRRLAAGTLAAFGLIVVVAAYWVVTGTQTISTRDDNPRRLEQRARLQRGTIYDRDDMILAESRLERSGRTERVYNLTNGALGYYSLLYGTSGAEAAFDDVLMPEEADDLAEWFQREILHVTASGDDIRLTLDHQVEQIAAEAMHGYRGGLVLLSVPDGGVTAMVSNPTFNPNTLDANWENLTASDDEPFFNRALQGNYQPGGTIYTMQILTALINRWPGETIFEDADRPVEIDGVTLTCATPPPASSLTLYDAYTFGCPAPFLAFTEQAGGDALAQTIALIRPETPLQLPDFPTTDRPITPELTTGDALGQGEFQVTILEMAAFTASVINTGNAPRPYILDAIQPAGSGDWQDAHTTNQRVPITTPENARRIAALMRQNVSRGTAASATTADYDIGGQAALGYAGDSTFTWFIGFVRLDASTGYSIALVLEDTADRDLAAQIGGMVLQAAAEQDR